MGININEVVQNDHRIVVINRQVIIDGVKYPEAPGRGESCTSVIIDGNVYINGYELKNGRWKRTLRALFHLYF